MALLPLGGGWEGACYLKLHFRTLRATYPVLLSLLDAVAPLYCVQSVQESLCVGTHSQTPLSHLLLFHRETAAHTHTVNHLVIRQHRAQPCTPVHHCLAHEGNPVVHQHVTLLLLVHRLPFLSREVQFLRLCHTKLIQPFRTLLLKISHQLLNRTSLSSRMALLSLGGGWEGAFTKERAKHLLERPLRPLIIARCTSPHLSVPVEAETNLVQLLTISVNILERRLLRVLTCLNGILLSRKTIRIITHRVQHVISLQPFETSIDVTGDIT